MTFVTYSACIALLVVTLLCDLWVSRTLRRAAATPFTKSMQTWWPLHMLLHLAALFVIASTGPAPVLVPQVHLSRHNGPGPFSPSFPPQAFPGKKERVEHL